MIFEGATGASGPPGPPAASVGGVTYVRWGSNNCPSGTSQTLLYSGRTGSTNANQGGAANYICMPDDPDYMLTHPGVQAQSSVYGTEYEAPPLCLDAGNSTRGVLFATYPREMLSS